MKHLRSMSRPRVEKAAGVTDILTIVGTVMTGIGGLMPWANRLWFVTYVAHKQGTGSGTGLFSIDDGMNLTKQPAGVTCSVACCREIFVSFTTTAHESSPSGKMEP